jgi:carbonic anhydrase/acetyltransferase-like protein (isoleucine patch superfamily)
VVGRQTFVGGEVILGDFKPDGEVMVMQEGALVSAQTNLLGCAVGHGCRIMMRATFYAGREIPNGYTIIGPPRDIVARVPVGLPEGEPLIAHDGVLEPYARWRAGVRGEKGG